MNRTSGWGGHGGSQAGTRPSRLADWGCLAMVTVLLLVIRAVVVPRVQYLQQSDWPLHMYPRHTNTIPSWTVPVTSILVPVAFFFAVHCMRGDLTELHENVLGLMSSVIYCGLITDTVKKMVGRPRPDFLLRCYPDHNPLVLPTSGYPSCTGNLHDVAEGMQSFPSGHTSWCTAGLGFLSLWLYYELCGRTPTSGWRVCVSLLPVFCAILIGITRIMDYWHHWTDVAVGFCLGMSCAWASFHVYYLQVLRHQQELRDSKGKQPLAQDDFLMASSNV